MLFDWDEVKRGINLDRHKLDFVEATMLFDGRDVITYPSPRGTEVVSLQLGQAV